MTCPIANWRTSLARPARRLALRVVAGLALALALGACNLHTVRDDPPPPTEVPEAFRRAAGTAPWSGGRWWERFGDPALTELVDDALAGNFDLAMAWARVAQAQAQARRAGAAWWPQVTADVGVSHGRTVMFVGDPIGKIERTSEDFNLSLAASYEVDLWGKVAATESAAELDVRATRDDLSSAAMTVAAQVADAWFALAEQAAQEALIERQIAVNETFLDLVRVRFGQGFASALDVYQQRLQLASTVAQLPPVRAQRETLENQLAVLLGRPPSAAGLPVPGALPDAPALPDTGLPADLLRNRPDVRAAKLRIVAADHRIAAEEADWLPSLRLSASTGFRAQDITKLFEGWIYSLAASLSQVIWDGGARSAEVERAEAVLDELVAAYGRVVLTALREVDDALAREEHQRRSLAHVEEQLEIARAQLDEARARYVHGLTDYLPVLTALATLQQLERSQLTAHRQVLAFHVQLSRALGGNWTDDLRRDAPERAVHRAEGTEPDDAAAGESSTGGDRAGGDRVTEAPVEDAQ